MSAELINRRSSTFAESYSAINRPPLEQIAHERFLLFQLRHRLVDLAAAEIIEWKFLNDLPFAPANADGEGRDQSFIDIVTSIRANRDPVPIVTRRVFGQKTTRADDRHF